VGSRISSASSMSGARKSADRATSVDNIAVHRCREVCTAMIKTRI
jgi:hypothetical protein